MRWSSAKVPGGAPARPHTQGPGHGPSRGPSAARADMRRPGSVSSNDQLAAPRPPFPGQGRQAPTAGGKAGGAGRCPAPARPAAERGGRGASVRRRGSLAAGCGPGPPAGRASGEQEGRPGPRHVLQEAQGWGFAGSGASLPGASWRGLGHLRPRETRVGEGAPPSWGAGPQKVWGHGRSACFCHRLWPPPAKLSGDQPGRCWEGLPGCSGSHLPASCSPLSRGGPALPGAGPWPGRRPRLHEARPGLWRQPGLRGPRPRQGEGFWGFWAFAPDPPVGGARGQRPPLPRFMKGPRKREGLSTCKGPASIAPGGPCPPLCPGGALT